MINPSKLDSWIQNNWNALFVGLHGTGKTSVVLDAFKRNNLKHIYFSAPTLDPWVDIVGLPREVEKAGKKVIEFVRPEHFPDDVEAIFIDELNRANSRVTNAVMELVQFKSINGNKFSKLKVVFAAVNPFSDPDSDDSQFYTAARLDEALKDRFHVIHYFKNEPDLNYFQAKFGKIGASAVIWLQENILNKAKMYISPRRLEYALEVHLAGGDIDDVIEEKYKPQSLRNQLHNVAKIEEIILNFQNDKPLYEKQIEKIKQVSAKRDALKGAIQQSLFEQIFPEAADFKVDIIQKLCNQEEIAAQFNSSQRPNDLALELVNEPLVFSNNASGKKYKYLHTHINTESNFGVKRQHIENTNVKTIGNTDKKLIIAATLYKIETCAPAEFARIDKVKIDVIKNWKEYAAIKTQAKTSEDYDAPF